MSRAVLVLGLLAALIGSAPVVTAREEPDLPSSLAVLTVGLVAVAVALGWRAGRGRAAAVVALLGLVGAVGTLAAEVGSGWVEPVALLLVPGALLVLAAPVLRRLRPRSAGVVGTVLGTVLVAGLVAGLAVAVVLAGPVVGTLTTATTAGPGPDPRPGEGARWLLPAGEVREVAVAGPGLVLATAPSAQVTAGTVVGLDTATGRLVWSHERAGSGADEVVATPDGRAVAVLARFRGGGRPSADRTLTLLDAASGRALWSARVTGTALRATDRVIAVSADGGLDARSRDTGGSVWRAGPAPGCALEPTRAGGTVDVVPVVQDCPGALGGPARSRSTVGLADATGIPTWATPPRAVSDRAVSGAAVLPTTVGGRFVAADDGGSVLDVRDGRPATPLPPDAAVRGLGVGVAVVPTTAPLERVAVVDPATGAAVPTPPCPVPRVAAPALVAGAPVVLCGLPDGAWELRGASGAVLTRLPPGTTDTTEHVLVATPGGLVAVPDSFRAGPVVGM